MTKKVLIVEDERDIAKILKTRLEAEGFLVDIVAGGLSALDYLKEKTAPDIIVLDLVLPDRSGIELLGSFHNAWPDTKIFIFTAHSEYKEKPYCFEKYMGGFFCKPDGMNKLIREIKKISKKN